ncbi:MAG TPA: class I SAM-dependent methyltransferase [Trichocoleus sp.]|jgi:trans-aconitate 2-methyltransferase
MMNQISVSEPGWNASLYQKNYGFIWQYGENLIDLLAPQPGERILDLGCGTGQLTTKIAETGAEVVGIDRSPEMIATAKQNYPELLFEVADARQLQFPQPFDAVFSNAVLHWILEPDAAIRSIYQALKPGGRLVAEFGGKGNVNGVVAALKEALVAVGCSIDSNLWYFPSISDYTTRLEQQGFEVTYAALFDRRTALASGETGLVNWLQMFAEKFIGGLPNEQQTEVIRSIETRLRPLFFQNGTWTIDYRRIQIRAIRR